MNLNLLQKLKRRPRPSPEDIERAKEEYKHAFKNHEAEVMKIFRKIGTTPPEELAREIDCFLPLCRRLLRQYTFAEIEAYCFKQYPIARPFVERYLRDVACAGTSQEDTNV